MLPEMPANLRRILSTYLFRKDRAKLVASFGEGIDTLSRWPWLPGIGTVTE